jgi:histidinol-phosphate aminotransferase
MDRRGFMTTGMAAGLVGATSAGSAIAALLENTPGWGPGKTLPDGTVKLSSNENPLGLSPAARQAVIEAIPNANRYPGDYRGPLMSALADFVGVDQSNLVLGAGSTEILQMAVQAYQGPNVPLVTAEPTFEDVPRYMRPLAYNLVTVPLNDRLEHDIGRMRHAAEGSSRPAVVYFCNPNNPTATLTGSRDIDNWIADAPETTMFLMDEAYFEYANDASYWSALKWIETKPNVIVVRTFSKIFGMAGMRLGYGVAHPGTAARMREFVMQNNPNVLAAAAGVASLADEGLMARSIDVNTASKTIVQETCDELGLETIPTNCNFMMHRINGDLGTYINRMREAGVRVGRQFPPMLDWNRLSFGLPEEQGRWAETLRDFRRKGWV